ncbi:MAG: nucleotidyltransferase substrate binding protein [Mangrovibacterium sp.]
MEKQQDIRWIQRFSNFEKALNKLSEAVSYVMENPIETMGAYGEIIKEGLIQRFEYTYEMSWNVMKDYAFYQGNTDIAGSRDAIRFAVEANLVSDGVLWMDMIKSRIKTSHTYNEKVAQEVYDKIMQEYHTAFMELHQVMTTKINR